MSEIKQRKRRRTLKIILIVFGAILVCLLGAVAYVYFWWSGSEKYNKDTMFNKQEDVIVIAAPSPTLVPMDDADSAIASYEGDAIGYNGKYYVLNENIISVVFMGIDSRENHDYSESDKPVLNSNQADTIIVVAFDTESGKIRMLNIPRDTLTDVKVLDAFMRYSSTERLPIAVQHSFGDGNKLSNQLMMETISGLLFGVPINRYLALNINGISSAADLVGGVTLELLDDFTSVYPDMEKGSSVNLTGAKAEIYVRGRLLEGLDGENLTRMKRQMQFAKAFISKVKSLVKENPLYLLTLYEALDEYYVTNLTIEESMFLAQNVLANSLDGETITTLAGETVEGGYEVDDEQLKSLVIEIFYSEITMQG